MSSDTKKSLLSDIGPVLQDAVQHLKTMQKEEGYWVFDLEADATIPAEYIMMEHYLDLIDQGMQEKLAAYLRRTQMENGGWPLFYGGKPDISASVKAYFALKLVGDNENDPHMKKARECVLALGGAERSNVFTRYSLALFGEVPWRAVPAMPVELMLMPKWFPITIWKVSYWSRTVIAPLLVLASLKPRAKNPKGVTVRELFTRPPEEIDDYIFPLSGTGWEKFFISLDRLLRRVEPYFPKNAREKAIRKAVSFFRERLNGRDGLGAILPAMVNSVLALDTLGERDTDDFRTALQSVRDLVVAGGGGALCQPCVSPVWDTALAGHALMEAGEDLSDTQFEKSLDWLITKQILSTKGDWAKKAPDLRPGGWAFQYENAYYPDTDDTAVVGMLLHRAGEPEHKDAIARAAEWLFGMQSSNGGWGAFDIDNDKDYLNYIPFADHGALLDPPTSDVTARCIGFFGQLGYDSDHPSVARAVAFLRSEQEKDGSWFGRWGTNYIYGTWSVLSALNAVGISADEPMIRRAVDWLKSRQRDDGGWGEGGETYWPETRDYTKASTPSQTAWAVLGLMAAGETESEAVARGIRYLIEAPRKGCKWEEPWFTAVGFPKVFYLRYDGYSRYFPIWAIARYKNLMHSNTKAVRYGL